MSVQTSDLPVIASLRWKCDECGERGELHMARTSDVLGVVARLKILHRQQSPTCRKVATGPSGMAEIDIPEGAVVNDPRETRKAIGAAAGKKSSILGAVLGAAALSAMPEPAQRHLEKNMSGVEPMPSPYSREARRDARADARARGANERLAAAEAKRQRKAQRRRGQP